LGKNLEKGLRRGERRSFLLEDTEGVRRKGIPLNTYNYASGGVEVWQRLKHEGRAGGKELADNLNRERFYRGWEEQEKLGSVVKPRPASHTLSAPWIKGTGRMGDGLGMKRRKATNPA